MESSSPRRDWTFLRKPGVRLTVEASARSTLAEDLTAIRTRIVASGSPLLDDDEVLAQVHASRGGYDNEGLA